jgi:glyoxylase-like metal-dependent hydrolase (beta-lactamase superfamily II)
MPKGESLNVEYKPMGPYMTNCYIVTKGDKSLIIDPGVGAYEWVALHAKNPVAILNTHGHFDHVWSNAETKEKLGIPIYVPKEDAFMLQNDPFSQGTPSSEPDVLIDGDQRLEIGGFKIEYIHLPGHTPGTSLIIIDDETIFSGDFIFQGSIGRVDFPYSDPLQMKKSIEKFLARFQEEMVIYPGHNEPTSVMEARSMLPGWIRHLSMTLDYARE